MKTLQFKITTILLFIGLVTTTAQKLEKKYTEKFIVNKDVIIDINTRYTDIEIETWGKNEVLIEAYIDVQDESDQKVIDDYLKKWNFEATRNKNNINISSKSSGMIDIHSFDFNAPDYDVLIRESLNNASDNLIFVLPELPEMPDLPDFPELLIELPELPEMPEAPELPELPPTPSEFDFEAYKKDKSYLERWKKENKDFIGKNAKIKVSGKSISINSNNDNSSYIWNITNEGQNELAEEIQERLEEIQERREEHQERIEIRMKERQAEMKERHKEMQSRIKERNEERKLDLIKRQEAHERRSKEMAKHRTEVRDILAKREKVKIKRIIKIKAPKDAKFNMNVRYGSMSFPK